jgi:hypothetical protein
MGVGLVYRDDAKRTYSEAEAAELLGMTVRMLAERRRAGKIKCIKDGRYIRYTDRHLAAYNGKYDTDPKNSSPEAKPFSTPKPSVKSRRAKVNWRQITPEQRAAAAAKAEERRDKRRHYASDVNPLDNPMFARLRSQIDECPAADQATGDGQPSSAKLDGTS